MHPKLQTGPPVPLFHLGTPAPNLKTLALLPVGTQSGVPVPQQSKASQLFGFGGSNSSCAGVGGAGVTLPSPSPSVTPKTVERASFAIVLRMNVL